MAYQTIVLNVGSGGSSVATDRVSSRDYQLVKLTGFGEGNVAEVSTGNPLPVAGPVTNAGTFAVQLSAAIPTGANTIGGVTVISLPALPVGTNSIGNIAQITTAIVPGTGATNLGKAYGNAYNSTDTHIPTGAVRDDALSTLSDAEGKYVPTRVDSLGALWVNVRNGITGTVDDSAFGVAVDTVIPVGFMADEAATDSVDEGDLGVARMTLDRKAIVTDYVHAAAGGSSSYSAISTAAVLTAAVKASPGKVYALQVFNINAAARYVRLYNMTTAPASTDTANVVWRGLIPPNSSGFVVQFPKGKQFSVGIGIRASTGIADNDTGALAANELLFNVDYA